VDITEKNENGKIKYIPTPREVSAKLLAEIDPPLSPGERSASILPSDTFGNCPDGFMRVLVVDEERRVSVCMGIRPPPDAAMRFIPYNPNWHEDTRLL
jgi:hypothetical protein